MFVGDFLDDGKINTSGLSYLKGMGIAGLTSGLVSFASSMYDYATWDRLSVDSKLDKLRQKYPKADIILDKNLPDSEFARYSLNSKTIYINDHTLESKSLAFSAIRHEYQHAMDHLKLVELGLNPSPSGVNWNMYESNAFNTQLANINADGGNLHLYKTVVSAAKGYSNPSFTVFRMPLSGVNYPKPSLMMVLRNIY